MSRVLVGFVDNRGWNILRISPVFVGFCNERKLEIYWEATMSRFPTCEVHLKKSPMSELSHRNDLL